MKIPYFGEENSLKDAPLFFWTFADLLKDKGFSEEEAFSIAYQGYRIAMYYPDSEQALSISNSIFSDSEKKQKELIKLIESFFKMNRHDRGQLNPEQEKKVKSFSPACQEIYKRSVSEKGSFYEAFVIVDSAQTMARDLQKEHAINSFCAGCAIYGVSREEYLRIQQKVFKYIHTEESLKEASMIAKELINR